MQPGADDGCRVIPAAVVRPRGQADKRVFRKVADRLDQALLVGLFVWLCVRLMPQPGLSAHWYALMLLVSEGVVLCFVLTRRSAETITLDPRDWLIAIGGTVAAMLVQNTGRPFLPGPGAALIMIGFAIHFGAKLSLRRSFGIVPADRGIKTRGLYALVRHPMYAGYMISHLGFLLAAPTPWNAGVYAVAWTLFITRIVREERLLTENPAYRAYAGKVRYRAIPGFF